MRYSINSGEVPYEKAVNLSKELRAAELDATITVGGIAIYAANKLEEKQMIEICKRYGVTPKEGITEKEGDAFFSKK